MEYALSMQSSKKANVSKYRKFENISSSHDVNAKRENANVGCRKVLLKGRRFEMSNVPKHLIKYCRQFKGCLLKVVNFFLIHRLIEFSVNFTILVPSQTICKI